MAEAYGKMEYIADKTRFTLPPNPTPKHPRHVLTPFPSLPLSTPTDRGRVRYTAPRCAYEAPSVQEKRGGLLAGGWREEAYFLYQPREPPQHARRWRSATAVQATLKLNELKQGGGKTRAALGNIESNVHVVAKATVPESVLTLTDGKDGAAVTGQCAYFVRVCGAKAIVAPGTDVMFGVTRGSALDALKTMVNHLYHPVLKQQKDWGKLGITKKNANSKTTDAFLGNVKRFGAVLNDAATSLTAIAELAMPERVIVGDMKEMRPGAFVELANNPLVAAHVDEVLEQWIEEAEGTLAETQGGGAFFGEILHDPAAAAEQDATDATGGASFGTPGRQESLATTPGRMKTPRSTPWSEKEKSEVVKKPAVPRVTRLADTGKKESDDAGPDTELEFWRRRMGMLNSITEQLKSKASRLVLGVANAGRSGAHKIWKATDLRLTDALNEAKDNVKYLTTLEKSLEPLYNSSPLAVVETLPSLINNVVMMYSVARYYGTTPRMTRLLYKISNQMIARCVEDLREDGTNLWSHVDKPALVTKLQNVTKLYDAYRSRYDQTKESLAAQRPKPKQFDFALDTVFGKFALFSKRCQKLTEALHTIAQFTELAKNKHIDGLEVLIKKFFKAVEEFKRKPYDLLEYRANQFDRDFLDFNVAVHDLETSLQEFINKSFENITSTSSALRLLNQFRAIMHRETLKRDLDDKYPVIFRNYGADLEAVQKTYELQKHNPPKPRNAPPVAGDILWARQLLRRIEEPMRDFSKNELIMFAPGAKRIVKMYNRVALALVTYEQMWHTAWMKGVEKSKAGLRATLLVKHPVTGALLVNFDPDIVKLIKEAKFMLQLDVHVPNTAKLVLAQEERFKSYFNRLTHLITEHERVLHEIAPVTLDLLQPHLADVLLSLKPGLTDLTWTSTNIDLFLKLAWLKLEELETLVRKINDTLHNRVDFNLKNASRSVLINLPDDQSTSCEEFVDMQTRFTKTEGRALAVKSDEVRRACDEIVLLLLEKLPRDETGAVIAQIDPAHVNAFKGYYARMTYSAVFHATKRSFALLKKKVGANFGGGFLFLERPFFEVTVQLSVPSVVLQPNLDDVQHAINGAAKKILYVSRQIQRWGNTDLNGDEANDPSVDYDNIGTKSFYDEIASDIAIVKLVLLLTGSVESVRRAVNAHLKTYEVYDFLYLSNLTEKYNEFIATNPSLDHFEKELMKYMSIEKAVHKFAPVHVIGPLSLETAPLKLALRQEAATWKAQFAKNLHLHGKEKLAQLLQYVKETTLLLSRDVEDLEDVRRVMAIQQDIRTKESEIDTIMDPITHVYALLTRYEVSVPVSETEEVAGLKKTWGKMVASAVSVGENLQRLQAGFKRELLKQVKQFVIDAVAFRVDWDKNGPMVGGVAPTEAIERLDTYQKQFDNRKRKWNSYVDGESLFGLPVTLYPELEQTEKELEFLNRLYDLYKDVISTIDNYSEILWTDVVANIEQMNEQVTGFQNQCRKLPKALRDWTAYADLRKKIDDFLEILPAVQSLAAPSMRQRHWVALQDLTSVTLDMSEDTFKLGDLLNSNLIPHLDEIEELTGGANKEAQVETKLGQIDIDWEDQNFVFVEFKTKGFCVLDAAATGELVEKLEDSQMALGSMATNRYSAPFKTAVAEWTAKLSTVGDVVEMWLVVQNMWIYMEAVFSGGDIVKQLPLEAKRFNQIDKAFLKMVSAAVETRHVVSVCYGGDTILTLLPYLTDQLELCQKSLTAFLDTKRAQFPRFYFVSDPTLLEILSLGSEPVMVTPHFQSGLFDSVTNVTFDKNDKFKMIDMSSQQGEVVRFQTMGAEGFLEDDPVFATGNIEAWLQNLVDGMQNTMKSVIKMAHAEVQTQDLETFIFQHPAQVSLLGIQFLWTQDMQSAITDAKKDKLGVSRAVKKSDALLKEMIVITTRSTLGKNERQNLETCITVHVHQRDTSEDLQKKRVRDPSDFEWMKQCRFYWSTERETVIISICDVDFEYSYEYLGVKERLVITPLTDICYVTLSQALGMFLGGAPAGPAGTGKTETTKDLGNTLGKFVVVFNCSDQMDYKGMGKIYRGLAQSGLWGCFDEFNRINLDVLSVCAQQVFCVLSAIRERKTEFIFTDGAKVSLDPRVGFFITMNPGYAGRQELPENLKSLFRGVTMMVPNRQIIKKVKLAACGYQQNEFLGKKFFVLYGLCEQQLSKQPHYDFGLRNILSVLRTMGSSKRANPDKSEVYLAMRTLRDMNMSKFVAEDVTLFLSLIDDIFPGTRADKATFPDVEAAMAKVATSKGLQLHPTWLSKCVQLYETYQVRHGIMLVGPTGAGKTAIAETLAGALTELGVKHVIWKMNPKAITAPQMFGRMDAATGDWTDGVFAVLWRRAAKEKKNNTWIILDGPVDAIWIENLNTVLDDNKVLTLANGDRVQMSGNMKAMFEPENLNNASPATVSRAGIIYVSETELGWRPLVASWLDTRPKAEATILKALFDKYVDPLIHHMRMTCKPVMSGAPWDHVSMDFCQVTTLITLLKGVLLPFETNSHTASGLSLKDKESSPGDSHYEKMFLYCVAWSLGGMLQWADRPKLSKQMCEIAGGSVCPTFADASDTFFEFFVEHDTGEWTHWRNVVPTWGYPSSEEKPKFARLIIPTLDSVRLENLLRLVTRVDKQALFVGGPGTAKTTAIKQFMGGFDSDVLGQKAITFSSLTTPQTFQNAVEASVEKRQGKTYGPPGGKKMILFIDDVSMPMMNEWGDQVTNEAVRQLLEQGGMYSLEKPIGDMKMIVDCQYLAAMNTPGGGKNDIPNRLKRHFAIFNVPLPSVAAINNIFGQLVAGRFASDVFTPELCACAEKLVPLTVELWNQVQHKMLPTPAKFHYLFNMRELSKVFQGVILAERDRFKAVDDETKRPAYGGSVSTPEGYLVALWRHECERVFCDKLTTHEDKDWGDALIMKLIEDTYGKQIVKQVETRVYFVDFLREPEMDEETGELIDANPSFYEASVSLAHLTDVAMKRQQMFNDTSKSVKLELVLFEDALKHMMRISRLLCMDRGSALLIGVGGSGKQSLTRLAAYIAGAFPFQIQITKTYNTVNLFEDLKSLYKVAGLKGQKVAFIFTDAEVKEESFLEYLNQLLMTGEVAGLFQKEEQDALVNDCRPAFKKHAPGEIDSYDNLWNFFTSRVRDNLHLCLCFSPVGDKFSKRARDFPGLINGCTIDWFLPWPQDALVAVSTKFIGDFEMACDESVKRKLQAHMGGVHVAVTKACREYFDKFRRNVYVTPKSYLSFIAGYRSLYDQKLGEVRVLADKINSGLSKLFDAKADVKTMQVDLAAKNVELAEAQKVSATLLKEISANTTVAEKEKAKVNVIVDAVTAKASAIAAQKAEAEADLAKAQPALDAALAALDSIKPKDITNLKAMKNPPDLVKRVFDCVLLLRQFPIEKTKWQEFKGFMCFNSSENYPTSVKMMGDSQFLAKLIAFPKERINDETCELLAPYFATPDFNPEDAAKASNAAVGLCGWAQAMVTYHEVAKVVDPKIMMLRAAEAELAAANKEKQTAEDALAVVQSNLDAMQTKFEFAMGEKKKLEDDATATQYRMDAASTLINALAGEEVRWTEQSKQFDLQIQRLTGDCAMASSFVSYLGPFNKEFRDLLCTRDFYGDLFSRGIPVTENLDVTRFLVEESEIGEWNLQGLPTDELSIQNGIMTTRATRYPVLVDPQGQGLAWIKKREEVNAMKTTTLGDKNFRNHLEDCMSFGKPMLIENIEETLDPILDPILEKRIVRKGKNAIIVLSDGKEVDFSDSFALYCTSRLPNPHYSPEFSAKTLVIDFTVTMVGLEDQLLGKLILKEKYELEQQRMALVEEVTSYKKKIKQLEDDLLFRLANSTGNLLDDVELIDVLNNTKQTAQDVNEKLATAAETNVKITEACEEYRPVAHRATLMYFLIAEFATCDVMYQTSLGQFNALYERAIDDAEKAPMPAKRIKNITEWMTFSIYLYIQRGLFERHKLTFALMLTNKIQVSAKALSLDLVNVFLKGGGSLDPKSVKKKPHAWIPDKCWLDLVAMSQHKSFADIVESINVNEKLWRAWYDKEAPEAARVPDFEDRVNSFERMCIVKALREDRTMVAAQTYISEALGERFAESVPLNMEHTWGESTPYVPLICLLSPGADPTKLIEELAKKKKITTVGVSMGQGQEIIARRLMSVATQMGQWVLLQNTHLGLAYMAEIEVYLLQAENLHTDFRLWITAEPHPQFPIGLLQMSIKITNEAPVGMRAGLRNSYNWVSQDMLDAVSLFEWRQMLFVMCYMHSIVQERRKFGPIGWNVPYEFNQSDLSACVQFLQNHLTEMDTKKLPSPTWPTVTYMVSSIQYGGRITDGFDELLMDTYAGKYFNRGGLEKNLTLFPGYQVPDCKTIEEIRTCIEALPSQDSPEVFGLHSNADLTFRTLQVKSLVETVVGTMPKTGGGEGGLSPAEIVDAIAEDLLGKVPVSFELEPTKERLKKLPGGATQPLTVHLRQEIDRLNIILDLCRSTLVNLRLAVAGTVALSGSLVDALDSLFDANVPSKWLSKSWESSTIGSWFQGLLQRHAQLTKWLEKGKPKAFWLTGFFNPQGFLTAMKQEVNRAHASDRWALDDVVMTSEVTFPPKTVETLKDEPSEGVYVYGLFLEGCGWDGKANKMVDSEPKKLYTALPVLAVTGKLAKDAVTKNTFETPCYKVKKRTGLNFISTFTLRSEDHTNKWIMRGVALLCSVD